jgi:hypothetical protein
MSLKLMLSLSLVAGICIPAVAQQGVDWEAKALATELHRLGDPDIDLILPDLYRAIARSPEELGESSAGKATMWRASQRSSLMDLLRDPRVRQELDMLDDQFEELQAKSQEIQRRTNGRVLTLLGEARNDSLSPQKVRENIQALRQEAEQEIEKAILPFQFRRLRQVALHVQMSRRGVADVLTNDPLASELGLTEEQKESLRETAEEVEKELAEEMAKLRAKAKAKLFAKLDKKQQEKLSEILGDEFNGEAVRPEAPRKYAGKREAKPNDKE